MAQGQTDNRTLDSWMLQLRRCSVLPQQAARGVRAICPHTQPYPTMMSHLSDVRAAAEPSLIYGHEERWRSSLESWAASEGR